MRVCLVYDCLFPHTVGGAERWYRNLAERLAARRARGHLPDPAPMGARRRPRMSRASTCASLGPRMELYTGPGRRRMLPPLVFGARVSSGTCCATGGATTSSTPRRSRTSRCLAAAARQTPLASTGWSSIGTRCGAASYWREYLGRVGGDVGWLVQRLCVRVPQRAFCFSRAARQHGCASEGARGEITRLPGEYGGLARAAARAANPTRSSCSPAGTFRRSGCWRSYRRSRWHASICRTFARTILGDGPERPNGACDWCGSLGLDELLSTCRASSPPRWSRISCRGRSACCCPPGARATGWS